MRSAAVFRDVILAMALALLASQPVRANTQSNWDNFSTALVFGLAGDAELKTLSPYDQTGQVEFLKTMAATLVLSEALKSVVHEQRPDGSGNDSFPSAHTSLAFAAATYFDIRYGAENKGLVPVFYGAAVLTAVGRVAADKHYLGDVVAGALIGVAFAHTFTTPSAALAVYPTADGVGVTYTKHF